MSVSSSSQEPSQSSKSFLVDSENQLTSNDDKSTSSFSVPNSPQGPPSSNLRPRTQGPAHYQSALQCYLQAVDIDSKDSVVWNQLGTLACSMALFTISRWAFEQGLVCSPNNWNCMEKLLEVLIAIGDEVACLSVAELILRHWPSQ